MKRIKIFMGLISLLLYANLTLAQRAANCPPDILLALARAGAVCLNMNNNQACYGYGDAEATLKDGSTVFNATGDITPIQDLGSIATRPLDEGISVATLRLQTDLVPTQQRFVTMLAIGESEIFNRSSEIPEILITGRGAMVIRALPEATADILQRLNVQEAIRANGISDDGKWLRVIQPDSGEFGWLSIDLATTQDTFSDLAVVAPETPFFLPFQRMVIRSGASTVCGETLQSGVILQTPGTVQAQTLIVNGIFMRLSGTVFFQTVDENVLISVVDGQTEVEAANINRFVPAGSQVTIPIDREFNPTSEPSDAVPFERDILVNLPINNLPFRLSIPEALTIEKIAQLTDEWFAEQSPEVMTVAEMEDTSCRRTVLRDTDLWAGPALFYEAINRINRGRFIYPILQTNDADGRVWWQLRNSNWIQASVVEETGECRNIPRRDYVAPPRYNRLSLETCMTTNGPIRAGQWVTLEFLPAPFEGLEAARRAISVDPGRITIDNRDRLYVWASEPILISPHDIPLEERRYVRVFSAEWGATPGTHRIIGQRLSYILNCDVTVPVG